MKSKIKKALVAAGWQDGLIITPLGIYQLNPNPENDTLDIEFLKSQA